MHYNHPRLPGDRNREGEDFLMGKSAIRALYEKIEYVQSQLDRLYPGNVVHTKNCIQCTLSEMRSILSRSQAHSKEQCGDHGYNPEVDN